MRNLLLGLCLVLAGCTRVPLEVPAAAPLPVTMSYPVERDVTDRADFTGRTAAVDSVEVRARVSGYLDHVNFKEGALVNGLQQVRPGVTVEPKLVEMRNGNPKSEINRQMTLVNK